MSSLPILLAGLGAAAPLGAPPIDAVPATAVAIARAPQADPLPAQTVPSRVVLISVDGLRADYLTAADDVGLDIPVLRGLMAAGTTAAGVIPPTPSNTMPAHVTLVTGAWPDRHGITDNDRFAPGSDDHTRIYHYYADIRIGTLFDAAMEAGLTTAAIGWPVTTGAPVDWLFPESPSDQPEIERFLYSTTSRNLRPVLAGLPEPGDERRFRLAQAALEARPALLALHVGETDAAQHEHGPGSPEALDAIETLDRRLGRFIEEACTGGHLDDTRIIVTADHGFRSLHTGVFLAPLFRALGLLTTDESDTVTEWQAYPWPGGGSSAIYVSDSAHPTLRRRADLAIEALRQMLPDQVARVYRGADLETVHGFPGAHAVIALREGYAFGGGFENPLTRSPTRTRGIHGYVPDGPDMHAAFVAAGPGIRAGDVIGTLPMTDIAPTVAGWLGVALPDADGDPLAGLATAGGPAWSCRQDTDRPL